MTRIFLVSRFKEFVPFLAAETHKQKGKDPWPVQAMCYPHLVGELFSEQTLIMFKEKVLYFRICSSFWHWVLSFVFALGLETLVRLSIFDSTAFNKWLVLHLLSFFFVLKYFCLRVGNSVFEKSWNFKHSLIPNNEMVNLVLLVKG